MHIKSISLVRFGSHLKTDITDLGKFCVFLGANGNGKSTILDAVSYALTGTCRGIDERGSGAEHAVTRDARFDENDKPRSFGITLTTDKGKIVRGLGEGPKARVQTEIAAKYGINPVITRALVQTGSFLKLPVQTQKQIVLQVAGSTVEASAISAILGPNADKFDIGAIDSVEAVDQADRELRAARPELKRQLNAIAVPEVPKDSDKAGSNVLNAEAQLREVRQERDEILDKASRARTRKESTAREQATLKKELADLDKAIESAPADVSEDLSSALAEAEKDEAERREKYHTLKSEVDTLQGRLDELKGQHDRFSKIKGTCPTCQRVVTQADANAVSKAIKDRAAKDGPAYKQKKAELDKLDYDQSGGQKVNDLRQKIQQSQEANKDRERACERKAKVEELLQVAANIMAEPAPAEADTRTLEEDISLGEKYIASQRSIAEAHKSRQTALNQKMQVDARLQACEDLIEKLGPKGPVRAEFMKGGGQEFEAEVAKMAAAVGIPDVKIEMGAGFTVYAKGGPAERLSESEKFRLNLAFAACISRRSGTGLLLLDGAEILDGSSQEMVNTVLEQAGLEQAFIAATPADLPKSDPSGGDWDIRVVRMDEHEHSRVEKLPALVAA